jgi:hypothetical protein
MAEPLRPRFGRQGPRRRAEEVRCQRVRGQNSLRGLVSLTQRYAAAHLAQQEFWRQQRQRSNQRSGEEREGRRRLRALSVARPTLALGRSRSLASFRWWFAVVRHGSEVLRRLRPADKSARATSAGRSGAEPPLSPIALPTSRALGRQRGSGPTPHSLDRHDWRRRYNFRPSSRSLLAPFPSSLQSLPPLRARTPKPSPPRGLSPPPVRGGYDPCISPASSARRVKREGCSLGAARAVLRARLPLL